MSAGFVEMSFVLSFAHGQVHAALGSFILLIRFLVVDWNVRNPCAVSAGSHGGCAEAREHHFGLPVLQACYMHLTYSICFGQWPMGGACIQQGAKESLSQSLRRGRYLAQQ